MTSLTTEDFWDCYYKLPKQIQELATKKYNLWKDNTKHPSLRFKCVDAVDDIWSISINMTYRGLGAKDDNEITWFWVGTHGEYDKILK